GTQRPRRLDELLLAEREHLAADNPRDVRPVGERDHEDYGRQPGLDQRAAAAHHEPEDQPGREQEPGQDERADDAAAVDVPSEDVAPEPVDSEDVRRARSGGAAE